MSGLKSSKWLSLSFGHGCSKNSVLPSSGRSGIQLGHSCVSFGNSFHLVSHCPNFVSGLNQPTKPLAIARESMYILTSDYFSLHTKDMANYTAQNSARWENFPSPLSFEGSPECG